jgi:hypothetical protein
MYGFMIYIKENKRETDRRQIRDIGGDIYIYRHFTAQRSHHAHSVGTSESVPNRSSTSILVVSTFHLIRGSTKTPNETIRKSTGIVVRGWIISVGIRFGERRTRPLFLYAYFSLIRN